MTQNALLFKRNWYLLCFLMFRYFSLFVSLPVHEPRMLYDYDFLYAIQWIQYRVSSLLANLLFSSMAGSLLQSSWAAQPSVQKCVCASLFARMLQFKSKITTGIKSRLCSSIVLHLSSFIELVPTVSSEWNVTWFSVLVAPLRRRF